MPTDGADFGRAKACYGAAFTAGRVGADDAVVADIVARGLEREVRMSGGMPAFNPAAQMLAEISNWPGGAGIHQLLSGVDALVRQFSESALTRDVADAALKVGLARLREGRAISAGGASVLLLAEIGKGRCDQLSGYLTRNRTQCPEASAAIISSIKVELCSAASLRDLADRMGKGSAKGLPARAPKTLPIEHSAEALNTMNIEGGV